MTTITNSGSSLFSGFTGLFSRAFSGVGTIPGKAVTIISSAASPITSRIPLSFQPIATRFNAMPKFGKAAVVILTVGAIVAVAHRILSKKAAPAAPAAPAASAASAAKVEQSEGHGSTAASDERQDGGAQNLAARVDGQPSDAEGDGAQYS